MLHFCPRGAVTALQSSSCWLHCLALPARLLEGSLRLVAPSSLRLGVKSSAGKLGSSCGCLLDLQWALPGFDPFSQDQMPREPSAAQPW
eukprot:s3005_g6.t1